MGQCLTREEEVDRKEKELILARSKIMNAVYHEQNFKQIVNGIWAEMQGELRNGEVNKIDIMEFTQRWIDEFQRGNEDALDGELELCLCYCLLLLT